MVTPVGGENKVRVAALCLHPLWCDGRLKHILNARPQNHHCRTSPLSCAYVGTDMSQEYRPRETLNFIDADVHSLGCHAWPCNLSSARDKFGILGIPSAFSTTAHHSVRHSRQNAASCIVMFFLVKASNTTRSDVSVGCAQLLAPCLPQCEAHRPE